jgi:cyclic beta-1,2-glucan synthetase
MAIALDTTNDEQVLRGELFSIDLLQRHARSLAQQHDITTGGGTNHLLRRLSSNEKMLAEYNDQTLKLEKSRHVTPAGEWLLDNHYLIEEQIRMARRHLPRSFNRELPHLRQGPCRHLPRVYHLACELISHVDGRIDNLHLTSFIAAYQEIHPLKLGELWAVPIMLRLALIENLRRVASLLLVAREERELAQYWAERILKIVETEPTKLISAVGDMARMDPQLTQAFVTEFWRRMQESSTKVRLALNWMEERLAQNHISIEQMIQGESQDQAAHQLSVGNSITSLRFLDAMDWREFVEGISVVEEILYAEPAGVYPRMDFATRDAFRHVVERIAKHSPKSEQEIATLAVEQTRSTNSTRPAREKHVGYYFADQGLKRLEELAAYRAPLRLRLSRLFRTRPLLAYVGGICVLAAAIAWIAFRWTGMNASLWATIGIGLLLSLSSSQLGLALFNWVIMLLVHPKVLPKLDFSEGIPREHATMVAVPTIISSASGVENLVEALEVRYLANREANLFFALLTDFPDAAQEKLPGDEPLVALARDRIQQLNRKYRSDGTDKFFLFHRPRCWNERDKVWMGYERKRGKLTDFNALLRGRGRERFAEIIGDLDALPRIAYVITLDTDTQLPHHAARELAGTMAHPLNRPVHHPVHRHVIDGYAILQPHVAISVTSVGRSRFAQLLSGDPGIDPYTRAVSDVYQDLFREGSFIGKGIYDVDAFEQALHGRFPENRILSHDLLESSYARSGLVTDVTLVEDFPTRYSADVRRRHRWMRGDWQIARWLLPRVPGQDAARLPNPIAPLARWKIFDNLRRSLLPIALTTLLFLGWAVVEHAARPWTLLVGAILFMSAILSVLTDLAKKSAELPWRTHLTNVLSSAGQQLGQGLLTLIFLPYEALVSLDAMLRTLGRLFFTRRNLLEWQTASEAEGQATTNLSGHFIVMWSSPFIATFAAILVLVQRPESWWISFPIVLLWTLAPAVAWWISRPIPQEFAPLPTRQIDSLRLTARKTWRYFETFVNERENWLPPDNFQEYPAPVVAARTSPTNIGLAMLSALAARDFGYLTLLQMTSQLENTFRTLERLEKYQGHFYNWYDTRSLQPLQPLYVSTVDNGNLAGLLLTLQGGLLELADNPLPQPTDVLGLRDTLQAIQQSCRDIATSEASTALAQWQALEPGVEHQPVSALEALNWIDDALRLSAGLSANIGKDSEEYQWWRHALESSCRQQREELLAFFPWLTLRRRIEALGTHTTGWNDFPAVWNDLNRWPTSQKIIDVQRRLAEWITTLPEAGTGPAAAEILRELSAMLRVSLLECARRAATLESLAALCAEVANMDFTLLFDKARKLFSIGYNVSTHKLDGSYYDLLASEARLASYVAIALDQVPQDHWFALGRLVTSVHHQKALISWSGSMFEYLMPMLVMPDYQQTLLHASVRAAVQRQMDYGKQLGVPWGISESGYNLTDAHSNYQYRAFGVPGLGFKRGLADDVVIAPYATVMVLMVAPQEASANLDALRMLGAEGRFGFYEALDYTKARLPREKPFALIQSFMAHHQGMALLSLSHCLLGQPMPRRFLANPIFKAAELLLQERIPKDASALSPHESETERNRQSRTAPQATYRLFTTPHTPSPEVHLLSNGRYHVMVTNAGGGYSVWNETALTRWREDATCDCWGTFIYLREAVSGEFWSAAHQPTLRPAPSYEAVFSQGRAEFRTRLNDMDSYTEIAVSPEDDVEVRRITLTNHSGEDRELELTSFAEVVLSSAAADLAHPAFNKLFIQTEFLKSQQAIICSRRPRSRGDQPPWMFHLMLALGEESGEMSFETDRSKFLGRGRDARSPNALETSGPLSNTAGSVLDPAMALRRTLHIGGKQSGRIILVTGCAPTREALLALIAKYQDHSIADRVFELAWTHSMVTMRHLNATEEQSQMFARLAGALLYSQPQFRAAQNVLTANRRGQRNLWSFGVSGDLPIVLVRSTSAGRIELVHEMLQAHAYWRLKGLSADLVIINEDDSVYRQSVHDQIISLIVSSIEGQMLDKRGGIFVRRADQLSPEDRTLLQAAARIVLSDDAGTLAEQLALKRSRVEPPVPQLKRERNRRTECTTEEPSRRELIFDNGVGGFTPDGREYVITLRGGETTPAPWVNVIANAQFGTLVSESGAAYTWAENCHEFRLTPWSNDPVIDPCGEAFYIRDEESGEFWSPTPAPARGRTPYVCRHGFGYSVFEHVEDGISSELTTFVATDDPVKIVRLVLRNTSDRTRLLSVTGYWEWVLGELRQRNQLHVVTEYDPANGAILARNSYNTDFEGRIAFVAAAESKCMFTCDRNEFIGRNGTLLHPAALTRNRLFGKVGAGLDSCAVFQTKLELEPGEKREVIFKMGVGRTRKHALALLQMYRRADACRDTIYMVRALWNDALGAVQVETPDTALNVLANGWLLYQTISCRVWARTGLYQSGGAFGFRDQLQDTMALIHSRPTLLREQLLRAAAHQFREGDVQHWWHPPHDRGVRTHFSDDYLWLPYATCRYVDALGDTGVLEEKVPFLEGRLVRPDEESYYDTPRHSEETGTLYEHCVRAIRNGLKFGEHGLPLMGCGDWNDGMNLVGEHGQGESVWLAFFLSDVLQNFSRLARQHDDEIFARFCETQAATLRENIEEHAWDGHWYRRAYFDNGRPLGSASNEECQIDALPQSWAVLTSQHPSDRARAAMNAVAERLVRPKARLIQLFDPPFDKSALEPGYIKGYLPGVRENGGQYTHGAIWTVMAFAKMGETDKAWRLFNLLNPVRHAETAASVMCYKLEPYVIAADVYSLVPHTGRGGWSWYTGSAGWFYRLIAETFLGLRLEVNKLYIEPRLPSAWNSFKLTYRYRETKYQIKVTRISQESRPRVVLDGVEQSDLAIPLKDDRRSHVVEIFFHSTIMVENALMERWGEQRAFR